MLELYDKYFKTVIIEIPHWEIPNPFERNEKNRKSQGRNNRCEEKWKGNLELKKCNTKVKSMDRLNSRMEETAERINELEDRTDIAQSKQQREETGEHF